MKRKILIIDDDPGVQEILQLIFNRAGYDVSSEGDAREILNNKFELPDIILLDRYLSGMDGTEICRHLKSDTYSCNIPVIMVSASPDIATVSMRAGADGFIEKPFSMKSMLSKIESTLNECSNRA